MAPPRRVTGREPARSKAKRPAKSATSGRPKSVTRAKAARSAKQQFLASYAREHTTTLKVLRALPQGQSAFRPHERSQSASDLIYTLITEQELTRRALAGGPVFGGGSMPPKPADFSAGIEQLDRGYAALVDMIKRTPDARLQTTVQFPTAPGQMGQWPVLDFVWYMLLDQIHHRGQLSVYVRMAGGKVPSIYGPSGDEPWS
jgi:uncharacterized damage-inducible protein DinB